MNGLWKLATDAAGQASSLAAQGAEAVSPHANSALNAVKSGQILPEEQVDAAKRAAEAVGRASAGAAVATGAVLAATPTTRLMPSSLSLSQTSVWTLPLPLQIRLLSVRGRSPRTSTSASPPSTRTPSAKSCSLEAALLSDSWRPHC